MNAFWVFSIREYQHCLNWSCRRNLIPDINQLEFGISWFIQILELPVSSKSSFKYLIQTRWTFSSIESVYKSLYDKYESLFLSPKKSGPKWHNLYLYINFDRKIVPDLHKSYTNIYMYNYSYRETEMDTGISPEHKHLHLWLLSFYLISKDLIFSLRS